MLFRMGLGPLAACVALYALPQVAVAQTKIAVINMQKAILDSAEIKKADAEFQGKYKARQADIDKVNTEIAKLQQQLDTGQDTMTASALADIQGQLARRQRDLQRMNEDLQADTERDRNEILSRTFDKMTVIVKALAAERGYDLVMELMPNAIYFNEALDITKDATAAYDKAYPVAAAAAAPARPAGK